MSERSERVLTILGMVVLVPPMFVGLMMFVSMAIETVGRGVEEHDRCLKRATTGYEIKLCK